MMLPEHIIKDAIPKVSGFSWDLLTSRCRQEEMVLWRMVCISLLSDIMPTIKLGKLLNRNHSTIVYHENDIPLLMAHDRVFIYMRWTALNYIRNNYGEDAEIFR